MIYINISLHQLAKQFATPITSTKKVKLFKLNLLLVQLCSSTYFYPNRSDVKLWNRGLLIFCFTEPCG